MSIVNNANPGSNILVISTIDNYLISEQKKISHETLKQHLRPDTLPKSDNAEKKFIENLSFWLERDLWSSEDDMIFLRPGDEKLALEYRLLQKIINAIPDKKSFLEGNGVEPFALYITCLLEQDRYTFAGGERLFSGGTGNIVEALSPYATLKRLPNSSEHKYLLDWATFIGFMEPDENSKYMLDPTRAILPYLEQIFAQQSSLYIQEFLQELGNYLPMFWEGRFVQYLTDILGEPRQDHYQISAALSHALCRLEAMNKISLHRKSDDINALQLYMPQRMTRPVSTISYRNAS